MKYLIDPRQERLRRPAQVLACGVAILLALWLPLPWPARIGLAMALAALAVWLVGRVFAAHEDVGGPASEPPFHAPAPPAGRPHFEQRAPTRPAPLAVATSLPSHRDSLTGLRNWDYLDAFEEQLLQALRNQGAEPCVLCVEVDGLAPIEQRYGRAAADQLRRQVAKRLRQLARQHDTVARLDGERFMMLIGAPAAEGAVLSRAMAARIVADIQRPFSYRTLRSLHLSCGVGAALGPFEGAVLPEMLVHATDALKAAQQSGPGQFRQYVGDNGTPAAA